MGACSRFGVADGGHVSKCDLGTWMQVLGEEQHESLAIALDHFQYFRKACTTILRTYSSKDWRGGPPFLDGD